MKRDSLWLRGWVLALALVASTDAVAATATANVSAASTSEPKLNGAGDAWSPFGNALGVPNSSKSIKVLYLSDDASVYPLNVTGATVQLRPSSGGPMLNCTHSPTPPLLDAGNAGTCTFRAINTAGNIDTLEIFHLGMLTGAIRVTATGIAASGVGNSVDAYDSDDVLPGTPPIPATAPPLSRKPARLVLVLDRSGSMAWTAKHDDPACGPYYSPSPQCRRWDVLQRAISQMVSVAKAYGLPPDELGLVFFNGEAEVVGAGIGEMSVNALDDVLVKIDERGPLGATSIGAGIQKLLDKVVGPKSNNDDFNNTMLLFTDGAQNTPDFLVFDGTLKLNGINSPIGATPVRPAGQQLRICPFKLRLDDPADTVSSSLLDAIKSDSDCQGMQAPTTLDVIPSDMIQYFVQVLAETLVGDKLEAVHASSGVQAAPAGAVAPPLSMSFRTSEQDLALTVLLGWDRAFQADGFPTLSLRKDGVAFDPLNDPAFRVDANADHVSLTLRTPFCNAAGECVSADGDWTLEVTRTLARGPGHWNLLVLSDNASISSSYQVHQPTPGVGEPLQVRAILTEAGAPLAGLASGSVRAFISGPSQGLGNVLSAGNAKPGEAPEGDAISPAGLKVKAMLEDPAQRDALLAALELGAEQGIALTETGPGEYLADFPATLAEGIYRVTFRIEGDSPGNGAFTRVFTTDHYVRVQPDDAATAKTLVHQPAGNCPSSFAGGCVQLTVTPVDASGNLVGPGKSAGIQLAQPFDGALVGATVDNLDGSYSLVIGYEKPGTGAPTLQIDGLPLNLPDAVAPGERPGTGLPGRWWWWLLALLLLIVILVWWRRRP